MTSATLALLIGAAILAQVALVGLFGWHRQQARFRALGRIGAEAGTSAAPALGAVGATGPAVVPVRQAIPGSDPSPAWTGYREFQVQRRVMEDAPGTVCSLYLTPVDGQPLPSFRPGQYLTFRFEVPDPAGGVAKSLVRCYSLSERPRTEYYRVSVKRVPPPPGRPGCPPGAASNHVHDRLTVGARVWAKAPAGHFYLDEDDALPVVLVAGGIGLTPLLCILNTLVHRADPREVWLFYGVRNGAEHVMKEHLETLAAGHPGLQLQICYADPRAEDIPGVDYHHRGHVDLDLLRRTLRFGRHAFYVCGPPPMMEALVPALEGEGVPGPDIHYESFGPASLTRPAPPPRETLAAQPMAVQFRRSGKTVAWDGTAGSLLELAEDQGVRVDSGCRAGSCGSCETRIEHGEVTYSQQPDADVRLGHCLLCIATPKGDLTLDL